MKPSHLDEQLHELSSLKARVTPRADWATQNKEQLFSQIRGQEKQTTPSWQAQLAQTLHIFVPAHLMSSVRSAAVVALAFVVTVGGWSATVSAAANSIPGEALYSVKRAAESGQLLVTRDKKEKAKLKTDFAGRRSEEISRVIKEKKAVPAEVLTQTTKEIESLLQTANADLQAVKAEDINSATELAKDLSRKTDDIVKNLSQAVADNASSDDTKDVAKEVAKTKKVVADVGIEAIDFIVKAKQEGANVSDEELAEIVVNKINNSKQANDQVKAQTQAVKKVVEQVVATDATSTSTTTASSSVNLAESTSSSTATGTLDQEIDITDVTLSPASSSTINEQTSTNTTDMVVEKVKESVTKIEQNLTDADVTVQEVEALLREPTDMSLHDVIYKIKKLSDLENETTEQLAEVQDDISGIVKEESKDVNGEPIEEPIAPVISSSSLSITSTDAVLPDTNTKTTQDESLLIQDSSSTNKTSL